MKLRLAYVGTPDFSARLLEQILKDAELPVEIVYVVTQPDKPVGKKKIVTPSPVKRIAQQHGLPVYDALTYDLLLNSSLDLVLLLAYGDIIPAALLSLPRFGFWNIHPSLLPSFRGPSPTAYPLLLGEEKTGVTLMKMDEKIDHGNIVSQIESAIKLIERRPHLEERLTELGFTLFKKNVRTLAATEVVKSFPQNHTQATYTRLLRRNDGFIALSSLKKAMRGELLLYEELPAITREYLEKQHDAKHHAHHLKFAIYNLFRGLFPWPGIYTMLDINDSEKRLKITDLHLEKDRIIIDRVQLEGKNEVDFSTFNSAYAIF